MFFEIEARRSAAGIEQKALCARAGVHQTTYTARKNGRRTMSERTLKRLDDALTSMIHEKKVTIDGLAEDEGVRI
ncbi:helix-turn-helix domain-containing protein [Rhizobium tumorigenes]|uniref:helix-turn-helix domain-containing protein n=1 Tax=Rhizobium tumorigenes TaxID=2041385 RepID=UPI00241D5087|nr:helix-turn-helix transcriptional regulator [Rhizobium tumorigenes]WFS02190.1 helix-turn-helix transcriptional regulator [Rhizobium tumorigenes]